MFPLVLRSFLGHPEPLFLGLCCLEYCRLLPQRDHLQQGVCLFTGDLLLDLLKEIQLMFEKPAVHEVLLL